jgi:hypothetical protein
MFFRGTRRLNGYHLFSCKFPVLATSKQPAIRCLRSIFGHLGIYNLTSAHTGCVVPGFSLKKSMDTAGNFSTSQWYLTKSAKIFIHLLKKLLIRITFRQTNPDDAMRSSMYTLLMKATNVTDWLALSRHWYGRQTGRAAVP